MALNLNDPDDAHRDERLKGDQMCWLSTVRPDGRPHLVPVWFLWENGTILIFTKPDSQKARNLRQNNRVALSLDNTDKGEDVVCLEGEAELLDVPSSASPQLPSYVAKYGTEMANLGSSPEQMTAEYSQAIRITPTRFLRSF